jgi:hypothetical protein
VKLVKERDFPITDAYHQTVSVAYEVRDVDTRVDGLIERLTTISHGSQLSDDLRSKLRLLQREIERLLGAR